jgi:hypothetical protein
VTTGTVGDVLAGRAGVSGLRDLVMDRAAGRGPQRTIHGLLEDPDCLTRCLLTRVKFKPGRKLSAHYEVLVRDRDGGLEPRSVAVTWIPADAGSRDGRRTGTQRAATREVRRRGLDRPFREVDVTSRGGTMRVLVSPIDEDFPQLARLSDPRYLAHALSFEGHRNWSVTTVRYRPGQRHVLRYDAGGTGRGRPRARLYAKLYTDDAGRAAATLVGHVADRLEGAGAAFSAWRPLAYIPADLALVSRALPGTSLAHHLQRPGADLPLLLCRTGEGLRALQGVHPDGLGDLITRGISDEIAATVRAGEHVAALNAPLGARYREALERARELADRLPDEPPCFAHGDLKADHVWDGPDGLVLMDFDSACLADPALDCGKLLADLRWAYGQSRRSGAEAAQAWFLRGYLEHDPHVRLTRCRVFEAVWLVKLAARRVPVAELDWSRRVLQLLQQAESVLDATQGRLARLHERERARAASA